MTKRTYYRSIGIAGCLMLLTAGAASAEIIQCTDNTGSATFTDIPCVVDARAIQALPVMAATTTGKQRFATAEKARSVAVPNNVRTVKSYSLDERTVRGAKVITDAMDIASELARQQASAEKALRRNPWAFWRL